MPPLARIRAVPWLVLFELVRTAKSHIDENLSEADRRKAVSIVKRSKGDPRALSDREKAELKRIAGQLNIARLAQSLAPSATRLRGRRGFRR